MRITRERDNSETIDNATETKGFNQGTFIDENSRLTKLKNPLAFDRPPDSSACCFAIDRFCARVISNWFNIPFVRVLAEAKRTAKTRR